MIAEQGDDPEDELGCPLPRCRRLRRPSSRAGETRRRERLSRAAQIGEAVSAGRDDRTGPHDRKPWMARAGREAARYVATMASTIGHDDHEPGQGENSE